MAMCDWFIMINREYGLCLKNPDIVWNIDVDIIYDCATHRCTNSECRNV